MGSAPPPGPSRLLDLISRLRTSSPPIDSADSTRGDHTSRCHSLLGKLSRHPGLLRHKPSNNPKVVEEQVSKPSEKSSRHPKASLAFSTQPLPPADSCLSAHPLDSGNPAHVAQPSCLAERPSSELPAPTSWWSARMNRQPRFTHPPDTSSKWRQAPSTHSDSHHLQVGYSPTGWRPPRTRSPEPISQVPAPLALSCLLTTHRGHLLRVGLATSPSRSPRWISTLNSSGSWPVSRRCLRLVDQILLRTGELRHRGLFSCDEHPPPSPDGATRRTGTATLQKTLRTASSVGHLR